MASAKTTLSPQTNGSNTQYQNVVLSMIGEYQYGTIGQGGWQVVDRPKSVAATQWFDRSPFQLSFDAYIDHQITNPFDPSSTTLGITSVESDCIELERWLDNVPGTYQPPIIKIIDGPVPQTAINNRLWVLYSVEFQDSIRDFTTGERVQQKIKIVLYEYVAPLGSTYSPLAFSSIGPASKFAQDLQGSVSTTVTASTDGVVTTVVTASGAITKPTWSGKYYTIKNNDTLAKIAAHYGSSSALFKQYILSLNNIQDAKQIAKMIGKKIKIPKGPSSNAG
jgi:LysM repeat protein